MPRQRPLTQSDPVAPRGGDHIDPANTVGGQAVLEGVMMRAPSAWSVAVRKPDGEIVARRDELKRLSERNRWAKIPFIRGIFVLVESLSLGFRALSWSAQKATDEEEEPLTGAQIAWTMALAFTFFAGVFIILPALAAGAVLHDHVVAAGSAETSEATGWPLPVGLLGEMSDGARRRRSDAALRLAACAAIDEPQRAYLL